MNRSTGIRLSLVARYVKLSSGRENTKIARAATRHATEDVRIHQILRRSSCYSSLNWKDTLKFPTKPRLSTQCTDLMTKLLCEPEDRLGSQPGIKPSVLTVRSARVGSILLGLGSDGVEQIKAHPWFEGIDWDGELTCTVSVRKLRSAGMHRTTPPYHPALMADDDTRHFDDDIPNEVSRFSVVDYRLTDQPLVPAGGIARDATKDPLLKDKKHGADLLEIRKKCLIIGRPT